MATVTLSFTGLPDQNPYSPPTDWLNVGQVPAKIQSGAWSGTSTTNTIWIYSKVPTGLLTASVVLGSITPSESRGLAFCDVSGNGYLLLVRSADARLFRCNAGVLGTQVGLTYSGTFAVDNTVSGTLSPTGEFIFYRNGVQFATFNDTTFQNNLRAGIFARSNSGFIKSVSLSDYNLYEINTFTASLAPGEVASGTQTGFANGAITANFGGLIFTGTVAGTAISGAMASFTDNMLCPFLPASAQAGTFTQGGNTANITRLITVQAGFRELRDANGNPSNFANLVTDDDKYLYKLLADAGFIINTADRCYFPTAYGLIISPDGGIQINSVDHPTNPIPGYPFVATLYVHKGADSRLYEVALTINKYTDIPGLPGDTKTILKAVVKSILGTIIH